jgi:hypothetical protein
MAGKQSGPTASTTKKDAQKPTEAKVAAKRTVTYLINTAASKSGISLAYAVAVDDVVQDEYANKVSKVTTDSGVGIRATVDPGQKVTLFLNSDAAPGRRKNPVYAVTPKDKNVQVTVTEKLGKHSDSDTPTLVSSEKTVEKYKAPLTGDIWKKITHKFTSADVDTLVPKGTRAEVITTLKAVYAGLPSTQVTMTVPASEGRAALTTTFSFEGNENAKSNINNFSVTADGLPRVHPAALGAVFTAAADANVSAVSMSSNWRPCLGSIAHRSGLGLDVSNVGGTQMLKSAGFNSKEIQLKNTYKAAKEGPAKEQAKKAWEAEHNKNEPTHVQAFRRSLQQNAGVKQVFDPWELDYDTTDNQAATANTQGDGNAQLHANHLHVTARDEHLIK